MPVAVCPGHAGICPPITQHQKRGRRVFLSYSQSEDMFWSVDTVNFVIDTGVEKRCVSDEGLTITPCLLCCIYLNCTEKQIQIVTPIRKGN